MMPVDTLVALLAGDLATDEADAAEAHLLGCDACSALADALAAIADGVQRLAGASLLRAAVTTATAERLRASGLARREYHLEPGEVVSCTVGATEHFNLLSLAVDPGDARRIDVLTRDGSGALLGRVTDVPVDRATRAIWMVSAGTDLRRLPSMRFRFQVVSVEDDGGERMLGEYSLDHTAFSS